MKKLFILCLMATTLFALESCKKDPVIVDDNGNPISDNQKPIASFTYTTSQITGGLAIKCTNASSYATGYLWELKKSNAIIDQSTQTNPTFNVYSTGVYTLTLTATNGYGSNYTQKTITITAQPNGYEIKSLKLTKIPMKDSNNASWDTGLFGGGDPDIFFKIMNEDKTITYCTGEHYTDVSTMPISWTIENTKLQIGTKYIIQFLDYDDGVDVSDVMANCIWEVKASQEGQTTINWNAQNGTISFVVGIKWLYPSKGEEQLICVEEGSNEIIGEIE